MTSVLDFTVNDIHGKPVALSEYKGKVLLITNTASRCMYTHQYEGLQQLYAKYRQQGLVVLGFPCDQFGHQEPGDNAQIESFCATTFAVEFPLFEKIEVNGSAAAPLYRHLKDAAPGLFGTKNIKWNFTKFLIDRNGRIVKRYAPRIDPGKLEADVAKLLS